MIMAAVQRLIAGRSVKAMGSIWDETLVAVSPEWRVLSSRTFLPDIRSFPIAKESVRGVGLGSFWRLPCGVARRKLIASAIATETFVNNARLGRYRVVRWSRHATIEMDE